jgi:ubiquinone/menaquinone biosynthesis C-methylase UbiE
MFIRDVKKCSKSGLYIDITSSNKEITKTNIENFSDKWNRFYSTDSRKEYDNFQSKWFETLYGLSRNQLLKDLNGINILDAGCGGGDKTHSMSKINQNCYFWGADLSNELETKSKEVKDLHNIEYIRSDIAELPFKNDFFDLIICDQVLHHTENPQNTLFEFNRLLKQGSELLTYVYNKKADPRELLDQYFIDERNFNADDLFDMSLELTILGKFLQENFKGEHDFPGVSLINIPAERKSLQRFIYDNFIKCFYNSEMGFNQSVLVNYDWYIPDIAYRYSLDEFKDMCKVAGFEFIYLHTEPSCISGRLKKIKDI